MKKTCTILRACASECKPEQFRSLRPAYFSKFKCAASLLKPEFGNFINEHNDIFLIWDGPKNELFEYIASFSLAGCLEFQHRSNQLSLKECLNLIKSSLNDYSGFFLSEDDHCYLPGAWYIFREGLHQFKDNFIALGDHPHRYWSGNNDVIGTDGVFLTKNRHWRTADSFVFSFGFSSELFIEFEKDFHYFNDSGHGAVRDRDFFHNVIQRKKRLFTPIPAMSTHMIQTDMSPLINWAEYHNEILL